MSKNSRSVRIVVVLLAVVGALPPAIAYWVSLVRTPTIAAENIALRPSPPLEQSAAVLTVSSSSRSIRYLPWR
jgi:hypothetical protein